MKLFSGFPNGKLEVTPLPNLFFSELLPAIADLAELEVTLHIIWLLAHSKSPFVRASDLRADRTLMQSLKSVDAKPEKALARGLTLATERGTLLGWSAEDALYFLNTDKGRRAFEKIIDVELPPSTAREPATVADRPNIFMLYEQNIGLLTPIIAEDLKDAELLYSAEWIAEAFKLAVENNKRSWSYARKILQRWKEEGRAGKSKKKTWYDEYGKFVKR
mgnify:CR=1 FL=1